MNHSGNHGNRRTERLLLLRKLTVTAIISAVSFVLMLFEFSTPFTPGFLKFDFSDLPAIITAFTFGPLWGVMVELIKNLLHMPFSATAFVGELANFLIGFAMVLPSGLIYHINKTRKGAVLGSLMGSLFAALISFPVNYWIAYPFYTNFMSLDTILGMYKAIIPAADTLPKALLMVNVPFTFIKYFICAVITFVVYKRLSPVLKGRDKDLK